MTDKSIPNMKNFESEEVNSTLSKSKSDTIEIVKKFSNMDISLSNTVEETKISNVKWLDIKKLNTFENHISKYNAPRNFSLKKYSAGNIKEFENTSLQNGTAPHTWVDNNEDIVLEDSSKENEYDDNMEVDSDGDMVMKEYENKKDEDAMDVDEDGDEDRDGDGDRDEDNDIEVIEARNDEPKSNDDTSTIISSQTWENASTVYDKVLPRNENDTRVEGTQMQSFNRVPIFDGSSDDDQKVNEFYMKVFMYYNCFESSSTIIQLTREKRKNILKNILELSIDAKLFAALLMNEFTNDMAYYTKQTFKLLKRDLKKEKQIKKDVEELISKNIKETNHINDLNRKSEIANKKIKELTLLISNYSKNGEHTMGQNLLRLELEYGCHFFVKQFSKFKLSPTVDFDPFELVIQVSEKINGIVTIDHMKDIPKIMTIVKKAEKFMETGYNPLNF
ncbi:uncharacterized protein SAPINGB_P000397 [Magnusiomyces paraingens]|uniref:Uncharacterized protein n=1 Tax=Magnusiomyces paraingens TaxID=2606893 RepID=A0A5E8B6C8_9ASCO|nr:uncharacterized protein SAPINGB_P000397 [Saprochaete ingens]VVT44381.1 unnamed protein product [Saprochaete ingens]